jgi:CRISPR-associated endoribonuclease Cas6
MRLKITLSENTVLIPFDYQYKLMGCVHKWIGLGNSLHGEKLPLHAFSWLQNVQVFRGGLETMYKESYFYFSAHKEEVLRKLIAGINQDNTMFCGIEVEDVNLQATDYKKAVFKALSPIFCKALQNDDKVKHLTYEDTISTAVLTDVLRKKLLKAGLHDELESVSFVDNFKKAKTRLVRIHDISNKASYCPVKIVGSDAVKRFAINVGIGHQTGSGFGCIG